MSQQLLRRDEIVLFVNQRAVLFAQSMQRFASVYAMRLYPDENAIEDRLAAIMLIERGIPPLVSEIQAATTNAGTRAQGGLTPDLLTLSRIGTVKNSKNFFRVDAPARSMSVGAGKESTETTISSESDICPLHAA